MQITFNQLLMPFVFVLFKLFYVKIKKIITFE